ncbi:MAG: protein O-mannosyl-transferase family [Candidatus Velthaea sp.]
MWDIAEAQTVPYIAGIMHPTGFPAYTIAGWLFAHVFAAGNVAWRMSVLSALAGAVATALLARTACDLGVSALPAFAAALAFGLTDAVWKHASRAGTQSLAMLFAVLALGAALERRPERTQRAFVAAAAWMGLAMATHPLAVWFVPGMVVLLAAQRPRTSARTIATACGAFAAMLLLYAYLPLRSAAITAAQLDPVAAVLHLDGYPIWNYDAPARWSGFLALVTGAEFHAGASLAAPLEAARYPEYAARFADILSSQYGWLGVALIAAGAFALRRRPLVLLGLALTAFLVVPFSLTYGALFEAEKYYLLSAWIAALLLALGMQAAAAALRTQSAEYEALPVLLAGAIAGVNLASGTHFFDQRNDRRADALIDDVRANVPDRAVVWTPWWYATALAHAAYVRGDLGARIPVSSVAHDRMVQTARAEVRPLYYIPLPESDIRIDGARLTALPGSDPVIYRVEVP